MGEQVRIVIPWRSDGDVRDTLWAFCSRWWEARGVVPTLSESPPGPFNRGAAINAGLAVGDWVVAVIMDADVIAPSNQLFAAAALAAERKRMVLGFTRYIGLAPWGTRRLLDTGNPEGAGALRVVHNHESSLLAVDRSTWELVDGFDERFAGWGQDDVSFCQACRVLGEEPLRIPGDVFHLWHPPAPNKRYGDPLWEVNQRLGARYRAATSKQAMQELLWERRESKSSAASMSATSGTG